jgi:Ni,Fe-hydrogenase I small subunit
LVHTISQLEAKDRERLIWLQKQVLHATSISEINFYKSQIKIILNRVRKNSFSNHKSLEKENRRVYELLTDSEKKRCLKISGLIVNAKDVDQIERAKRAKEEFDHILERAIKKS